MKPPSPSRGYAIVQPLLEPNPSLTARVGPMMLFLYVRLSSWGIGIEIMKAGGAVQIGPFMFGACHINEQLSAFDAERTRIVAHHTRSNQDG